MSVTELRAEICKLPFEERAELTRQLHGWVDDHWDRQMAQDAQAGLLDGLLAEAESDVAAGRFRNVP